VVVNDLNLLWPGFRPDKAEPELVVDTDAVLAMAVSPERLQAIAWWNQKVVEASGGIQDGELAEGHASEASKPPHRLSLKEGLGVAATKRPDHRFMVPPSGVGTKRGGIMPPRSAAGSASAASRSLRVVTAWTWGATGSTIARTDCRPCSQ